MGRKLTHEEFIEKLSLINPNIEPLEKYMGARQKIKCKCKVCNTEWYVVPYSLYAGCGCPSCGNLKKGNSQRKSEDKFLQQLSKIQPNIDILTPYISARKPITYKCRIHNYTGDTNPDNLLRGFGCPYCAGKIRTKESFYKDVKKLNSNINFLTEYTTANNKITCECKKCGNIWATSAKHLLEGSGCPVCNISKGENVIAKVLSEQNIKFLSHKRFNDLHGVGGGLLSYDFHLPDYNLLIEFQGKQHEQAYEIFGGEQRLKVQQEHDKRKRDYANSEKINLLEIWYYDMDNIENIISDVLKNVT